MNHFFSIVISCEKAKKTVLKIQFFTIFGLRFCGSGNAMHLFIWEVLGIRFIQFFTIFGLTLGPDF